MSIKRSSWRAARGFWNWVGHVDTLRGKLGVIGGLLLVISGGTLALLRALGLANTLLAAFGIVAILAGAVVLAAFLSHLNALRRHAEDTAVPDIVVAITEVWYIDDEKDGRRYLAFPVEVINRESTRPVSLTFKFVVASNWGMPGSDEPRRHETPLSADLRDRDGALPDPFRVEPLTDAKAYHYSHWYLGDHFLTFREATDGFGEVALKSEREELFVNVTDRLSAASFTLPIPGTWSNGSVQEP